MAYGSSYRPRFSVDRRVVAVAAGLYLALMFYPVTQANFPDVGLLAGVPVGLVVGILTPRSGDELNNVLMACAVGAALVVTLGAAYGSFVSWQVRFPLDSVLAGQFTVYGFFYGGSSSRSTSRSRSPSPSWSARRGGEPARGSPE